MQRNILHLIFFSEFLQFTPTSIKNRKELFKSINNLYNCTQQGIPELSHLILEYFNQYRNFQIDHIFLNLLSWTVITSFDNLKDKLLDPFLDVFIHRYLLDDQIDMIDCLSNLVVNFVSIIIYRLYHFLLLQNQYVERFGTSGNVREFRL